MDTPKVIKVYLDQAQYMTIKARAKAQDRTITAYIRCALGLVDTVTMPIASPERHVPGPSVLKPAAVAPPSKQKPAPVDLASAVIAKLKQETKEASRYKKPPKTFSILRTKYDRLYDDELWRQRAMNEPENKEKADKIARDADPVGAEYHEWMQNPPAVIDAYRDELDRQKQAGEPEDDAKARRVALEAGKNGFTGSGFTGVGLTGAPARVPVEGDEDYPII